MTTGFAPADAASRPLHLVDDDGLAGFLDAVTPDQRTWLVAIGFKATLGQLVLLPGEGGAPSGAVFGLGSAAARIRGRFHVARAVADLPDGTWHLDGPSAAFTPDETALGWLLASYRFTRYKTATAPKARLKAPHGVDVKRIEEIAASEALTRELINTPASDMGPDEIEAAVRAVAADFGAQIAVTQGDDLLPGFPMIHAVGRASPRAPRLIDLTWGSTGPRLTLVGKGVCFDTGGLDLKPAAGMGLMKKDMGGAATALGLARSIMALDLPLRLRLLIPAVENSVAGNAFRPQDILTSRKGLTVEINNTDAEGRLILADALTLADEGAPDLIVSMATLTGAARTAVGPDLAPFYCDDDRVAAIAVRRRQPRRRSPVENAVLGPVRVHDRTRHRRPRQCALGRHGRVRHRRPVPAPLCHRHTRLCAFRHLRLAARGSARPPQGRRRPGCTRRA